MFKHISVILAAALVCACGEPRYIIRGDVSGLDGMVYMLDSKRNPVDSVMAENGRFEFSGPFTDARRCFITDNSDLTSISKYVLLFIEKGGYMSRKTNKACTLLEPRPTMHTLQCWDVLPNSQKSTMSGVQPMNGTGKLPVKMTT